MSDAVNPTETTTGKGAASRERHRLDLPAPGNRPANRLFIAGLAFYLIFATVLVFGRTTSTGMDPVAALLELLGLGAHFVPAMFVLVVLGVLLFLGASFAVLEDIRQLRNEEEDVEFLIANPHAPTLVLVPPARRVRLLADGITDPDRSEWGKPETVLDDRVRRFIARQGDRNAHFSPEELRILAEQRVGRLGVNARFASSLLLLLAVLGTFSGVKSALPELIRAAQTSTEGMTAMIRGLEEVAGAFGANSLALVAAISVSLMSQGLSVGRRHFLERLEHASEPLFSGVGAASASDPLTSAMDALKGSAEVMSSTAGSIKNLESVVNDLNTTFRDSFQQLTEQLENLALQQERSMHEKTAQEFRQLQSAVQEMTETVESLGRVNTSMVESIGRQHQESRDTVAAAKMVFDSFDRGVEGVTALNRVATSTASEVQGQLNLIRSSSQEFLTRLENSAEAITRVQPNVQRLEEFLTRAVEQITANENKAATAWSKASQEVTQKMGQMLQRAASERTAFLSAGGTASASGETRSPLMSGFLHGVGFAAVLGIVWLVVDIFQRITGR